MYSTVVKCARHHSTMLENSWKKRQPFNAAMCYQRSFPSSLNEDSKKNGEFLPLGLGAIALASTSHSPDRKLRTSNWAIINARSARTQATSTRKTISDLNAAIKPEISNYKLLCVQLFHIVSAIKTTPYFFVCVWIHRNVAVFGLHRSKWLPIKSEEQ